MVFYAMLFLVIFGISVYTSVLVDFVAIFKICVELSPETEFSKRRQDLEFPTVNDNDTSWIKFFSWISSSQLDPRVEPRS